MRITKQAEKRKQKQPVLKIHSTGIQMMSENFKSPSPKRPRPGLKEPTTTKTAPNNMEVDEDQIINQILRRPLLFSKPYNVGEQTKGAGPFGSNYLMSVNPLSGKPMVSNDPRSMMSDKDQQNNKKMTQSRIAEKDAWETLLMAKQRHNFFEAELSKAKKLPQNNPSKKDSPLPFSRFSPQNTTFQNSNTNRLFNPLVAGQKKGERQNIMDRTIEQSKVAETASFVNSHSPQSINPIISKPNRQVTVPPSPTIKPSSSSSYSKFWLGRAQNVPQQFKNPKNPNLFEQKPNQQTTFFFQRQDQNPVLQREQGSPNPPTNSVRQEPHIMNQDPYAFERNYYAQVSNINNQINVQMQKQQHLMQQYQNSSMSQTGNLISPQVVQVPLNPAEQKQLQEIQQNTKALLSLKFPGSTVFFERLSRKISAKNGNPIPDPTNIFNRDIPSQLQLLDDILTQITLQELKVTIQKIEKQPFDDDEFEASNQTVGQFIQEMKYILIDAYKTLDHLGEKTQARLAERDQKLQAMKLLAKAQQELKTIGDPQQILDEIQKRQDYIETVLDMMCNKFIGSGDNYQSKKFSEKVMNPKGCCAQIIETLIEEPLMKENIIQYWNQQPESEKTPQEQRMFDSLTVSYHKLSTIEQTIQQMDSQLQLAMTIVERKFQRQKRETQSKRKYANEEDEGMDFTCQTEKLQFVNPPSKRRKYFGLND